MQTNSRDSVASTSRAAPGKDPVWQALIDDTDVPVAIMDGAGVFEFVNPAAGRVMGVDPGAATGKNLRDYFSEEMVTERLAIIRQAISTGKPVTIEGMVKGRMRRTVYRPMVAAGQPSKVLVVSRLAATAGPQDENGVVHSRVNESGALSGLTAREMEILKLIGVGLSTADIAKKLGRSVKTVEWHRVSLGDKLGVTNRVELARIAIAAGLVSVEEPVGKSVAAPSEN